MATSTRLLILIKNIYTLWGPKRFILHLTYLLTNLVYPFTLRVTGITKKSSIVEYLDYQIPDTQTDMARSTELVILIKNIYTLRGQKRFLLPCTYILSDESSVPFYSTSNGYNKEERYSGVPRLSDTRYSA